MIEEFAKGRSASSPVNIASMCDSDQLYRSLIYKPEKHAPVARDAKRQVTEQRFRQMLRVQKRIVRISSQAFDQLKKLAALLLRENRGAFEEPRMEDDFKHPLFLSRQEMTWRLRSGIAAAHLQCGGSFARIPGGIHPRGLSRRCLSRTSGAFLPPPSPPSGIG